MKTYIIKVKTSSIGYFMGCAIGAVIALTAPESTLPKQIVVLVSIACIFVGLYITEVFLALLPRSEEEV